MIWVAVVGCFLISFVFSGIEAGILSMNRVRLKHRVKHRASYRVKRLSRSTSGDALQMTPVVTPWKGNRWSRAGSVRRARSAVSGGHQ